MTRLKLKAKWMPTVFSRRCDDSEPASLPECKGVPWCAECVIAAGTSSRRSVIFVETLRSSSILRYNRAMAASAAILKWLSWCRAGDTKTQMGNPSHFRRSLRLKYHLARKLMDLWSQQSTPHIETVLEKCRWRSWSVFDGARRWVLWMLMFVLIERQQTGPLEVNARCCQAEIASGRDQRSLCHFWPIPSHRPYTYLLSLP